MGYWETLSQFVAAQMARTRLRERQAHLRRKLAFLQQMQGISHASTSDARPVFPSAAAATNADSMAEQILELQQQAAADKRKQEAVEESEEEPDVKNEDEDVEECAEEAEPMDLQIVPMSAEPDPYDSGMYSPVLLQQTEVEIDAVLYDAEDDLAKLEYQVSRYMAEL